MPDGVNGGVIGLGPKPTGAAPSEISYSFSARSRPGRALIRTVENLTGRPRLLRMALNYEHEVAAGRDFWQVMQERYGITIEFAGGGPELIPATGPLVVVANHPYGILDGLALGRILSASRSEFKILAHAVFHQARDLHDVVLPVDFSGTGEATARNVQTRRAALDWLAGGGAIGVFPGGQVSTAATPFARARDPYWKPFTARMIARSGAAVVPIHFVGANSRLFQVASHLNYTLRTALMINEFRSRLRTPLRVTVGRPLPAGELRNYARDPRVLMEYLRHETYALDPEGERDFSHGLQID